MNLYLTDRVLWRSSSSATIDGTYGPGPLLMYVMMFMLLLKVMVVVMVKRMAMVSEKPLATSSCP